MGGLSLRRKRPRRHVAAARRMERAAAARPNEQWSMDFVSDALFDGRRIRAPTLVGNFTRGALAIVVYGGIRGEDVVLAVEPVAALRGSPQLIRVDNGPGFVWKALDRSAYERGVTLGFSRPGKPTDNRFVESFDGRFRDECLDTHRFSSVEDARAKIKAWGRDYNTSRPHGALGHLTPREFAARKGRP